MFKECLSVCPLWVRFTLVHWTLIVLILVSQETGIIEVICNTSFYFSTSWVTSPQQVIFSCCFQDFWLVLLSQHAYFLVSAYFFKYILLGVGWSYWTHRSFTINLRNGQPLFLFSCFLFYLFFKFYFIIFGFSYMCIHYLGHFFPTSLPWRICSTLLFSDFVEENT
jgi:hypothetical protein